ncbi:hypothetical protein [Bradyrhizobium sp.]|jgi:hypothetical protein|uniref:hypothetical protein n=1 Tax=Bradyrhizobium sp. TaxID=376 RepID=UPI003C13CBDC
MARIKLQPDNLDIGVWWLRWVDHDEIIGRILEDDEGRCRIAPQGPRWSPMKSFAGRLFRTRAAALAEVKLYFRRR